jgi:O-antigen/teichoic acid export membrane protein
MCERHGLEAEASVARGAASLYLASLLTLILNTAYFVVLTNFITLEEVGLVSLLNILVITTATVSVLALPVVGFGVAATPPAVSRFLSRSSEGGGGSARGILLASLVICALASTGAALVISYGPVAGAIAAPLNPAPVAFAALDAVTFSFAQLGAYALIGAGRATVAGKLLVLSGAVRYLAASALVVMGLGVAGVFVGFAAGDFVLAISGNVMSARNLIPGGARFDRRLVGTYMASVLLASLIGLGVTQTDKLLAFFRQGLGNLGVYNVATVGAAVTSFAPSAVTNVLVPALGSLGEEDRLRRRALLKNYTRFISFIASPMGLGIAAVSPFLLPLFGQSYLGAAPILSVLALSISITAISSVYSSSLLAGRRAYLFSLGNAAGLLALVGVALLLVPPFGLLSVALGRGAMLVVVLASVAYFVRREGDLVLDWKAYLRSLFAASLMGGFIFLVLTLATTRFIQGRGPTVLSSIVMLPIGFALYLAIMRLMGGFDDSDIDFLRQLLPKRLSWFLRLARRFV